MVERYVVGGPRDGETIELDGENLIAFEEIPAVVEQEGGEIPAVPITYRAPHRYRACTIVYAPIGKAMDVLVSETVSNDDASTLVFEKLLSGWPAVRPLREGEA